MIYKSIEQISSTQRETGAVTSRATGARYAGQSIVKSYNNKNPLPVPVDQEGPPSRLAV